MVSPYLKEIECFAKFNELTYVVQLNMDKEDLKIKRKVTTIDEVKFELHT